MARAFVAVVPPREVLDAVGKVSWRAMHRPRELALPRLMSPRWTTRDQWHLTLQFLGTRVDLDEAAALLRGVRAEPPTMRLGGLGGFPSAKRANVLWVGAVEGARELRVLAASVADVMTPLAGDPDALPFHPHLTVARLGRHADLRDAIGATRRPDPVGPRWTVDRVVLFESVTASTGAQYREHADVPLRPPAPEGP
ncbi:MAG TPA: RNA 2',3'-cyclic phosphodiesterase [Acidimicrobiia bacterium]|nr:RNA 2',3'-cyclic phosphodiesterase [Acidimicrobiia bacterium]